MTMKFLITILVFYFCRLSIAALENDDVNFKRNSVMINTKADDWNDRARPDQKSLLIVFDTTGSMAADLKQLRSGAGDIVRIFSDKANDPIYNYVLSLFNDPYVEEPFITRNPEIMFNKLEAITVNGGGDCPELALTGLVNALEVGLPNSPAFLFSDASAKDYVLYDQVAALVQRKQSSVNFLLTGDCSAPNSPEFKVYEKISRTSGGQVFKMDRDNVRDVLVAMSVSLETDFVSLTSVDSDEAGSTSTTIVLDDTIKRLSVSLSGRNAKLSIKNSANDPVTSEETLSSDNIQIVTFDVADSSYTIEMSAESAFSLRVGGISNLGFEFGFSRQEISTQSETYVRPIRGQENVLSIFVSDLTLIENLTSVSIVPASTLENFEEFEMELKLGNGFFSTDLFEIPEKMFRIRVLGRDASGNVIDRVISTGIESISTMIPEVEIDYDSLNGEIYGKITLNCIVKSLTTVNVTWMFGDKVLAENISDQSSNLVLTINDFRASNVGNYTCFAENEVGRTAQQVSVNLKPSCNAQCPLDGTATLIPSYRVCSFYYECIKGVQHHRKCPTGTVFDSITLACGDPETSVCGTKASCNN